MSLFNRTHRERPAFTMLSPSQIALRQIKQALIEYYNTPNVAKQINIYLITICIALSIALYMALV